MSRLLGKLRTILSLAVYRRLAVAMGAVYLVLFLVALQDLASLPALLAGSACCAPAIVLILGLQLSSLLVTVFQVLIPVSIGLLLVALAMILHRTDTASLTAAP